MKKLLCCLMAAAMLFGAVGCSARVAPVTPDDATQSPAAATQTPAAATQSPDDVIVFDDTTLEASIREALGKPQGDITRADAETLTELELSQQGVDPDQPYIYSLSALQYFTNLTYLGLGYAVQNAQDALAPIDLSAIANLTNLESLQMAGVVIDDLSPLAKLERLTSLTLYNGGQPLDLSPLSGLVNLESLTLRNNKISDLTPLAGLIKLRYLDLEGNQITDVSPLAGLTGLNRLYLTDNPITDFSPLAELRANLEEWDFQLNP